MQEHDEYVKTMALVTDSSIISDIQLLHCWIRCTTTRDGHET